ncbi:MAG: glycosyltransferase family 4 protein [Planctomycetales bacterium]|nr:glycosyltransferase family 4 protein [Planctomycetales bacterium]
MQAEGYEVAVLTSKFERCSSMDCIDGVTVHRIPLDPKQHKSEMRFALRIVRFLVSHRNDFDLLHVNGHMDHYGLLTLCCKVLRKKILMQMVLMGSDDPESLKVQFRFMAARLRILRCMDRFLYISEPIGESCKIAGFPQSKLRFIPQGVDTLRFHPVGREEKNNIRFSLGLEPDGKIVTFVGAIIHRKGVDILIDSWREVQRKCPEAELILIGPCEFGREDANESSLNTYVENIKVQIARHKLNVRMVGRTSNVECFLQASDVFVLPSRKEGFGNVILEAMGCGIPIVVSFMDGVALESVIPGETGVIFNSGTELTEALIDMLNNDERRRTIGAHARADALRRFALDKIAQKYMDVYSELA